MKYFSIERIKAAIDHLSGIDGKWLIPSLVFALNGVNRSEQTNLRERHGTDRLLDQFFSGALIGLPPLKAGNNSFRPKFRDLIRTFSMEGKAEDYAIQQDTKLWANAYSRAGYRVMIDQGFVEAGGPSQFMLQQGFRDAFEDWIPETFKFEELLVWLYAFSGVPEEINSWQTLLTDLEQKYLGPNQHFSEQYAGRFKVSTPPVPWPSDFLSVRPTNLEFQRELMSTSYLDQLGPDTFQSIYEALKTRFAACFQGYTDAETSILCSDLISALTATKRVFLLGDPGVGKTMLAGLIVDAFRDVLDDDRLFFVKEPITDRTTPETLIGYGGITGDWIPGSLTSPGPASKRLLVPEVDLQNSARRNQVNVVILDECNRRNIESLLAKFQNSMDSQSLDPRDDSHTIRLDASGTHMISPYTYWVFTGNSPLNDQGRVPQSRPFRRRPNILVVPNILEKLLLSGDLEQFRALLVSFWRDHCQTGLVIRLEVGQHLADSLSSNEEVVGDLDALFRSLIVYEIGVSFGLIEKILRTTASAMSLGRTFEEAIDTGLSTALLPLLATERLVEERSLRTKILESHAGLEIRYPQFWRAITLLDTGSEFGIVRPFF